MDWNDICLVLTWSWHIHILSGEALSLDTHVELGLFLCLLEVSSNLIFIRSWEINGLHYLWSERFTNTLNVVVVGRFDMIWINWSISLRSHMLLILLVFLPNFLGIRLNNKTWNRMNWLTLEIGIWTWESMVLLMLSFV